MRILIISLLAGVAALPAFADKTDRWNCRNVDLEISCTTDTCKVSEGHTPIDIHLTPSDISLCAYTGCWTGPPSEVISSGRLQIFTGAALPFSNRLDTFADVSVTIDTETGAATVMVADQFATPAICTRTGLKVTIE